MERQLNNYCYCVISFFIINRTHNQSYFRANESEELLDELPRKIDLLLKYNIPCQKRLYEIQMKYVI